MKLRKLSDQVNVKRCKINLLQICKIKGTRKFHVISLSAPFSQSSRGEVGSANDGTQAWHQSHSSNLKNKQLRHKTFARSTSKPNRVSDKLLGCDWFFTHLFST